MRHERGERPKGVPRRESDGSGRAAETREARKAGLERTARRKRNKKSPEIRGFFVKRVSS